MRTLTSLGSPAPCARAGWRTLTVAALMVGLFVTVLPSPAAAAAPTVATSPALVPFSETPGQPGVTTLTFTANGASGLTACGQDNSQPPFKFGPVDPATPLTFNFPFIQAGTYIFWLSSDATCASGTKLGTATAARLGPTGRPGQDAVQFRSSTDSAAGGSVTSDATSNVNSLDIGIFGAGAAGAKQQTFPIPGVRLCIMSGDGAQVAIAMKVGQDSRTFGATAATTTVLPVAGQNGCFPIPWIVNGGYTATIARSGASSTFGFCAPLASGSTPSEPPTSAGIGRCAQVAFSPSAGPVASGTTITGSIVTGVDNHAVQVCVSAFMPSPNPFAPVPILILANTLSTYNGSGAVNLTPLKLAFPSTTVVQVTTYDITGPGPGGQGGVQFVCPPTTAVPNGSSVAIIPASVPGASIIDIKNYTIA